MWVTALRIATTFGECTESLVSDQDKLHTVLSRSWVVSTKLTLLSEDLPRKKRGLIVLRTRKHHRELFPSTVPVLWFSCSVTSNISLVFIADRQKSSSSKVFQGTFLRISRTQDPSNHPWMFTSSSGVLPIKIEAASKKWHNPNDGKVHALGKSSWISGCFIAQVLVSEKFKYTRSPSIIFCFVSTVSTRLGHSLAMILEESEREKKTTKTQLPEFQLEMWLEGFVKLAMKVIQTEMFFSLYDFLKVSNFSWYCTQNQ